MTAVRAKEGYVCPECGKPFQTPQGLGGHRANAHGYRNPRKPKRPVKRRRGRSADASPPAPAPDLGLLYAGIAEEIERAREMVEACVGGLDRVVAATRELRLSYIQRTDQVRKLRAEIDAIKARGGND